MVVVVRIYLALLFLSNLGGLVFLLLVKDTLLELYGNLSAGLVVILLLSALASMAAVILMWRWSRWGVYLVTLAYASMLITNITFGAPFAHTILGPIGLILLFALLWPVRHRFQAATDK